MKLTDLIGETTEYDKKEMLEERKSKSWLKSVSAFANGIGGALIFGIADDDTLVGLSDAKADADKISEKIKATLDPVPQIILSIPHEDGKDFIILKVLSGQETPYYYYADGNRIAYVRVGNESVPADAATLKRLVLHGSGISYDSLPTHFKTVDYAFTKLRSVYRARTGNELEDADFISFGLSTDDGMLTNAGALLSDECPIRHSRLFCTRWYGLDKASGVMEALDDKEFSGSLVSLLQNGEEFVKNNTKKRWKKTGQGRLEMPEYPEQAVLECIVNALIHRDYTQVGSEVHIDIFDDRMEVIAGGIVLLLTFMLNMFSSCSVILESAGSAVAASTYPSEDEDMLGAEAAYCAMEEALREYLETYESTHQFDEYHFDLDEIEHDPYVLISILSALKGDVWTLEEVQALLADLFAKQYKLTEAVVTETRYKTETKLGTATVTDPLTGEQHEVPCLYEEEVAYEYTICTVTLRNFNGRYGVCAERDGVPGNL